MSRIAGPILFVLTMVAGSAPLAAQDATLTAESALQTYNAMIAIPDPACAPDPDSTDIVVCKRADTRARLPLPNERGPREGARTGTGEVPLASAERIRPGSCGTQAGDSGCTGGLPIIQAVGLLLKAAGKIADPDQ